MNLYTGHPAFSSNRKPHRPWMAGFSTRSRPWRPPCAKVHPELHFSGFLVYGGDQVQDRAGYPYHRLSSAAAASICPCSMAGSRGSALRRLAWSRAMTRRPQASGAVSAIAPCRTESWGDAALCGWWPGASRRSADTLKRAGSASQVPSWIRCSRKEAMGSPEQVSRGG